MSFRKMFSEDGSLLNAGDLHEPSAADDLELQRMRAERTDLRAEASKLEAMSDRLFAQINEAAAQQDTEVEAQLQKERWEVERARLQKEEQAKALELMLEATPEERMAQWQSWNLRSLGSTVDLQNESQAIANQATEGSSSSSGMQPSRKARANNHAFQVKEEAKVALEKRMETKAAEDALAAEGMYSVKLKKIEGKPLGLKYGPGIVITTVLDDSSAATWNSENKKRQIQAGHKVVSINSKDNMQDMLKLLRDKDQAELEIVLLKQASVDDPLGSHLKVPLAGAGRARLKAVAALSAGTSANGDAGPGRGAGRGTGRPSRQRSPAPGIRGSAADPGNETTRPSSAGGGGLPRPSQAAERSKSLTAPRSARSPRANSNHGFTVRSSSARRSPRPSRDPTEDV